MSLGDSCQYLFFRLGSLPSCAQENGLAEVRIRMGVFDRTFDELEDALSAEVVGDE